MVFQIISLSNSTCPGTRPCYLGTKGRYAYIIVKGDENNPRQLALKEMLVKYNPMGCDCPLQDLFSPRFANDALPKKDNLQARYSLPSFSRCQKRWYDTSGQGRPFTFAFSPLNSRLD